MAQEEATLVHPDVEYVLFSETSIRDKVHTLAGEISAKYEGQVLVLVGVLKGASVFLCDLCRAISKIGKVDVRLEFLAVSSYGSAAKSSGSVKIVMDLRHNIQGLNVLIVEDILDTGRTLAFLLRMLSSRAPKSLETAVLLRKPKCLLADVEVQYVGFDVEPLFVVGYGLDYAEQHRCLPYIGVLRKEVYSGDDNK